jgi:hypothetical protein
MATLVKGSLQNLTFPLISYLKCDIEMKNMIVAMKGAKREVNV